MAANGQLCRCRRGRRGRRKTASPLSTILNLIGHAAGAAVQSGVHLSGSSDAGRDSASTTTANCPLSI